MARKEFVGPGLAPSGNVLGVLPRREDAKDEEARPGEPAEKALGAGDDPVTGHLGGVAVDPVKVVRSDVKHGDAGGDVPQLLALGDPPQHRARVVTRDGENHVQRLFPASQAKGLDIRRWRRGREREIKNMMKIDINMSFRSNVILEDCNINLVMQKIAAMEKKTFSE